MDTRILIIEDDEATAEVMRQVLADEGYTVEHAASPRQARALLAAGDAASWDLVISDAVLTGDGDPRAWLNELRVLTVAPVVIVTGWLQALFADYAERGFAAVVAKPFDLDELLGIVQRQVGMIWPASAPLGRIWLLPTRVASCWYPGAA